MPLHPDTVVGTDRFGRGEQRAEKNVAPTYASAVAVVIRDASRDDVQAVLRLLTQMNPDDPPLPAVRAEAVWHRIDENPDRRLLIATDEGDVVGTIDCTLMHNLTRGGRPFMVVENVVVDEGRRRAGIGRALLEAGVGWARETGCYKAQLVADDALANQAFYRRCGFMPAAIGFKARLCE